MEDRTYTLVDLFPDLIDKWKQDNCDHDTISYMKTFTNDYKTFWADGECLKCGKAVGKRIYWGR